MTATAGEQVDDQRVEDRPRKRPLPESTADPEAVLGTLSPSRASDFKSCPLLYRFRTVDRLPERPSPDAVRGTVVHKVLEDLFDLPGHERTPERAAAMVESAWAQVLETEPAMAEMFTADAAAGLDLSDWLESCRAVLERYFTLEDPRRLEPAERELYVETLLQGGLLLRGFVDRLDVAPDGAVRVVDYKTGRSPGEAFEVKAMFQMRFYALVIWRARGVLPAMLRLIYLGNGEMVSYQPDERDLLATERLVTAVWEAIRRAHETGDWRPRRSRLCDWCSFQAHCPEFGGTPPQLPDPATASAPVTPSEG
ncbi:MAG TPA: PD-(D/E)XK nuclease family protein [Marmoricola sp.]